MARDLNLTRLDQRTVERYLQRGVITQQDYDNYLAGLPDLADQVVPVVTEQPGAPGANEDEAQAEG